MIRRNFIQLSAALLLGGIFGQDAALSLARADEDRALRLARMAQDHTVQLSPVSLIVYVPPGMNDPHEVAIEFEKALARAAEDAALYKARHEQMCAQAAREYAAMVEEWERA